MFYPQTQTVFSESNNSAIRNESSRNLYLNNCARCHGADGKGNTSLGKKLDATDLTSRKVQKMSRKKIARVIYYGDDPMPSFGKKLDKKEIDSIVDYVRALK